MEMLAFLSNATKTLLDILCIAGIQQVTARYFRLKHPHRKVDVGLVLQQSVSVISILLFAVSGLQVSSFRLERVQSIHLALALWTKLRASAFYERIGLLAFVWTHCLQDYGTWNVMSLLSLHSLWSCGHHVPRVPSWVWSIGETITVMGILSWLIWTRATHWTLYMYLLYLPYEWVGTHSTKED